MTQELSKEMQEKIERDALDSGEVEILTYYALQIEKLAEALRELNHLHQCEMEGLLSGKPTPAQWYECVNKAGSTLSEHSDWLKT